MKQFVIIIEVIILVLIILCLSYVIIVFNTRLPSYLNSLKKTLIEDIKSKYGYELHYKKISPNIIGNIKVYEVVLSNENNMKLELGDINVKYSIFHLFKNNMNIASSVKKIELKSFNFKIDRHTNFDEIRTLVKKLQSNKYKKANNNGDPLSNFDNLVIEIQKGKLILSDRNYEITLLLNNLKASLKDKIYIKALIQFTNSNQSQLPFNVTLKTNGIIESLEEKSLKTDFNIDLFNISVGDYRIKNQQFSFTSIKDSMHLKRIKDSLPVSIDVNKEGKNIALRLQSDELYPATLFKPQLTHRFLPDSISLNTTVQLQTKPFDLTGDINLSTRYEKLLFMENVNLISNMSIRNQNLTIERLKLSSITEDNFINLKGTIPLKELSTNSFDLDVSVNNFMFGQSKINTDLAINKDKKNVTLSTDNVYLNNSDLGGFSFNSSLKNKVMYVNTLIPFNGYTVSGYVSKPDLLNMKLVHTLDNFSLQKVIRAYNNDFSQNLTISGEVETRVYKKEFFIKKSNILLYNSKKQVTDFTFSFYERFLNIPDITISTPGSPLKIKGWVDLRKDTITSKFDISRLNTNLSLFSWFKGDKLHMNIDDTLHTTYNHNKKLVYINAKDFMIPTTKNILLNGKAYIDIKNKILVPSDLLIKNVAIFKDKVGNINTKISFKDNQFLMDNFIYSDNVNIIEGNLLSYVNIKDKFMLNGQGFFKDDAKDESYAVDYTYDNTGINAKLFLTHIDINKFIKGRFSGFANLRLNIEGNIKNPNIDIEGDITDGKFGKNNLNSLFMVKKDSQSISIKKAYVKVGDNTFNLKKSTISLNQDLNDIDISGSVYAEGLQKILKTNFFVNGNFSYSKLFALETMDLNLKLENLTIGYLEKDIIRKIEKHKDLQFSLNKEKDYLRFTNTGKHKYIFINKIGKLLTINLFNKNDMILNSSVTLDEGALNGNISFNKFPVNIFHKLLNPFVSLDEGLVEGQLTLQGQISEPEFFGNLNVYYGKVKIPQYIPDPITNITGIVIAEKNKFLVRNVNATVRKGLAHGYGEILFNGWKFEKFLFHINSNTVPCKISTGPIDARGFGYIEDLIMEGRPKNFNFIGNFVLDSADINLAGFMGAGKKRNVRKLPLNVHFTFRTGKKIKVNYPIITGILNENETFVVKYNGEDSSLHLGGQVSLKKGDVNYLNKNFKVEYATFQFFEDEYRINPLVNLKAYWRTRDAENDTIKVYLNMTERLLPITTTFTSFPYKSEEEINGLLGLTYTWASNESSTSTLDESSTQNFNSIDTLINTTNYISNSFILNPIENRIRKVTGLDTFSMDTKLFGNIIKSNTSFDFNLNALDLLDETSLTIGKYLFNELYMESMLRFDKKDETNENLFLPFTDQNYGLNLQLMLQLELPYVMIGYTFLPNDITDIRNADHQISIEANFRF